MLKAVVGMPKRVIDGLNVTGGDGGNRQLQ